MVYKATSVFSHVSHICMSILRNTSPINGLSIGPRPLGSGQHWTSYHIRAQLACPSIYARPMVYETMFVNSHDVSHICTSILKNTWPLNGLIDWPEAIGQWSTLDITWQPNTIALQMDVIQLDNVCLCHVLSSHCEGWHNYVDLRYCSCCYYDECFRRSHNCHYSSSSTTIVT